MSREKDMNSQKTVDSPDGKSLRVSDAGRKSPANAGGIHRFFNPQTPHGYNNTNNNR
jgi:hypothetical protein